MNTLHLDPSATALVVIDLQKGIVEREAAPHASGLVVNHAAALAKAFRQKNMPVFLVRVTPSHDRMDALSPLADVMMPPQVASPDWANLVPELEASPADIIITKRQWGAFYGTELDLQLRRRNVKTIVLCGISTNIGVESTARDAFEHGYQQVFVDDAMSARSAEEHAFTVTKTFSRIGRVRMTQDVLDGLS